MKTGCHGFPAFAVSQLSCGPNAGKKKAYQMGPGGAQLVYNGSRCVRLVLGDLDSVHHTSKQPAFFQETADPLNTLLVYSPF